MSNGIQKMIHNDIMLWAANDEGFYTDILEIMLQDLDQYALANALHDATSAFAFEGVANSGLGGEFVETCLANVNWIEMTVRLQNYFMEEAA